MAICSAVGCDKNVVGRGLCATHYKAARRRGDLPALTPKTTLETLKARTSVDANGCWIWMGESGRAGYGRAWFAGRRHSAHRLMYELIVGPIAAGLQLDHLCRVPACVNPAHLEPVTPRENVMRGDTLAARNAAKTHCAVGHSFDAANTYLYAGRRECRACRAAAQRRHQQKATR